MHSCKPTYVLPAGRMRSMTEAALEKRRFESWKCGNLAYSTSAGSVVLQGAYSCATSDEGRYRYLAGCPTHPRHNVLDVINILLLLSFRVGVIKTQDAVPIELLCHPKAHKHGLHCEAGLEKQGFTSYHIHGLRDCHSDFACVIQ